MNRSQKRKFLKSAKKRGVDKTVADVYLRLKERGAEPAEIKDGDRVQLNLKTIQSYVDYSKLSVAYRQFVEDSADKIFTAQVQTGKFDKGLVSLKEDEAGWHFWPGDLIKVSE